MPSKSTLYYVGKGHLHEAAVFRNLVDDIVCIPMEIRIQDLDGYHFKSNDIIVLGGGEDISPALYNAKPSRFTHAGSWPSIRDNLEANVFDYACDANAMVVGICRGAQMIGAKTGNRLAQHVTGHTSNHPIHFIRKNTKYLEGVVDRERKYQCLSLHHQMVIIENDSLIPIMRSSRISKVAVLSDNEVIQLEDVPIGDGVFDEVEVFIGSHYKLIGIQGHPEYGHDGHEFTELGRTLVSHHYNLWNK